MTAVKTLAMGILVVGALAPLSHGARLKPTWQSLATLQNLSKNSSSPFEVRFANWIAWQAAHGRPTGFFQVDPTPITATPSPVSTPDIPVFAPSTATSPAFNPFGDGLWRFWTMPTAQAYTPIPPVQVPLPAPASSVPVSSVPQSAISVPVAQPLASSPASSVPTMPTMFRTTELVSASVAA